MRSVRSCLVGIAVVGLMTVAGCSTGSLATSESTALSSASPSSAAIAGPTIIVTVPELLVPTSGAAVPQPGEAASSAEPAASAPSTAAEPPTGPAAETAAAAPVPVPDLPTDAPAPTAPATTDAAPVAPPGQGLNVSLANCDGCTVLATHQGVTGDLSAALVGTNAGRAVLLSVGADGSVAGVIGVPYGAAFPAPDSGVLACEQARCVVQGRQSDGRAILSAFELTGTGAWRDVSGDDAFPSATERAAVIELGGELGIAVQDQGDGPAVWLLYRWQGDRFAVAGCAPDGPPPASADAVSPAACLS